MNQLLACALALLSRSAEMPDVCRGPSIPVTIGQTVEAVRTASAVFEVPAPIVIKVIYKESRFDVHARGALGEIGLMQLKPKHGAIPPEFAHLTRAELEEPDLNVWIGVRYMAHVSIRCPNHFLSRYNGGGCKVTRYSRRVKSAGQQRKESAS